MATAFLVDRAWAHLLHKPQETVDRLRALEDAARMLLAELEREAHDSPLDIIAAMDALRRFLGDRARGALPLALRLAPEALAKGKGGRLRLERTWSLLDGQGRRALERQALLRECRAAVADLEARFRDALPWHLDSALGRAGAADQAQWAQASSRFLYTTRRTLRGAAAYLERVRQALPAEPMPALLEGEWPIGVSPAEFQLMRRVARSGQLLARAVRRRERLAVGTPSPAAESPRGQEIGVLPLNGGFVVLEPQAGTPFVTEGEELRCGQPVRCRPWVADTGRRTHAAEAMLFEPCPAPIGSRVTVAQPALVRPLVRLADGSWLGSVQQVGRLKAVSGGRRGGATAPALRVRSRATALPPVASFEAEPGEDPTRTVLGITARPIGLALDDAPVGLLHTVPKGKAGRAALEHEAAFFRRARHRATGCGVLPLGGDAISGGMVYLRPPGVEPAVAPACQEVRGVSPTVLVTAVARLWLQADQAGLGIGLYHMTTLGFRLPRHPGEAAEACVLTAPLGVPELKPSVKYPKPTAAASEVMHVGIGSPDLPNLAAGWGGATRLTEARLAALMMLELLADPTASLPGLASWEGFLERLSQPRHRAPLEQRHPAFVRDALSALRAPDASLPSLLEWVAGGRL